MFVNKIVSCVLNKNLLPYTTNAVYFVLTSSEVQINGARLQLLPVPGVHLPGKSSVNLRSQHVPVNALGAMHILGAHGSMK